METPASLHAPAFASPAWALVRIRLATGALWVLVALAALGGLRGLAPRPAPPHQPAGVPAGVPGFAELYVATHLEAGAGDEASVAAFYPGPLDLTGVTAGARYVARAAAVSLRPIGATTWAVTVGADVLAASATGYRAEGTQYFRVAIEASGAGLVATSLPAAVPAPAPAQAPAPALTWATTTVDPGISATVTDYLQGTVHVTATVDALALGPPVGTLRTAVARVTAADPAGLPVVLDYALRLRRTPVGWSVDALLPAAGQPIPAKQRRTKSSAREGGKP